MQRLPSTSSCSAGLGPRPKLGDAMEKKGVDVNEWARQQAEKTQDAQAKGGSVPGQGMTLLCRAMHDLQTHLDCCFDREGSCSCAPKRLSPYASCFPAAQREA
jgi:hypothetical protein